jgi:hypothetical protein
VTDDKLILKSLSLLLQHDEVDAVDSFNLTLAALSFDDIANCNSAQIVRNSLRLTSNKLLINLQWSAEVLECNYKMDIVTQQLNLVLEQFTDALVKNNSHVDIFILKANANE